MNNNGNNRGVSVIIPVYNEEEAVQNVIRAINGDLKSLNENCEVIVVNDGSTDNTRKLLEEAKLDVRLINHDHNMGYGAALKTGIKNAKAEIIVITDADGTYPNDRIPELVRAFEESNYDMVVGARTGKNVSISLIRKPAKWFLNKLANYLSGYNIPDLNSGLRVMKKEVVQKFTYLLPDGFSFTSTITLAMLSNGYSVKYIPVDYHKRKGKSKIRPVKDTLNFIQLIFRMVLYFDPLRVFVPLSVILVLLSFVVLIGSWVFFEEIFDVTFGTILMSAVMVLAIGMLADLIDKKIR